MSVSGRPGALRRRAAAYPALRENEGRFSREKRNLGGTTDFSVPWGGKVYFFVIYADGKGGMEILTKNEMDGA